MLNVKIAIKKEIDKYLLKNKIDIAYSIESPKMDGFGDYSTNVAMKLSKHLRKSPLMIYEEMFDGLSNPYFDKIEFIKGFINFTFSNLVYEESMTTLDNIDSTKKKLREIRKDKKVLVEYGSVNPTGPLHVGHGRNVVVGDIISSIYQYLGYSVSREYYVNDAGSQIDNLAKSVQIRYLHLLGSKVEMEEGLYLGEYVIDIAKDIQIKYGDDKSLDIEKIKVFSLNWTLNRIKNSLIDMGINYDNWVSEQSLYLDGAFDKMVENLKKRDLLYDKDEALWFKSTLFGDDKDRVILKKDGSPSYYSSDLLYSKNKVDRGFENIVTVLGSDHHGYLSRYEASFLINDFKKENIKVALTQLVLFFKSGELVKMSKRSGDFFTLEELVNEIGKDSCRVFFLTKKNNTQIDFDIDLAKKKNSDNPLFYMQYAHARICSIEKKIDISNSKYDYRNILELKKEEKTIIKKLNEFYDMLEQIKEDLEVHKLVSYGIELSAAFHSFYNNCPISSEENIDLKNVRINIIILVRSYLRELFSILDIVALESM